MKFLVIIAGLFFGHAFAEPVKGPVIDEYGAVYYVPDQTFRLPPGLRLKAVFDIAAAPEAAGERNYRFETVARHLNLHVRAGLPADQLDTVIVLHGRAARSALGRDAFEERYGELHPDMDLLEQLTDAGVRIIVCGQSATAYGFRPDEIAPGVEMWLSALTSLIVLQGEGYALIPWGTS